MKGIAVGVQMYRVEVDDRPRLFTEERQAQFEAGAEQDPVELLGMTAVEGHGRAIDRCDPGPHRDSAFRNQR